MFATSAANYPPYYFTEVLNLHTLNQLAVRSALGLALLTFSSNLASAGPLTVSSTVTGGPGSYLYSYTVTNGTADDPFVIDIPVLKLPGFVTNLIAPTGFKIAFDSGLGLVSFLEDSSFFTSTPVSGFSFRSIGAPGNVSFAATTLSSTSGNVFTLSGPTQAPVPEPGYLSLVGLGLSAAVIVRKKFRFKSVQ